MQKYFKEFKTRKELYTVLADLCPELDLEKTLAVDKARKVPETIYHYCDRFGKVVRVPSAKSYLQIVVNRFKLPVLLYLSTSVGFGMRICATEDIFNQEVVAEAVEVVEELVFDARYAKSLDNGVTTESKKALYEYGVKFGADLKRNKGFDTMLADLKKHIKSNK